MFTFLLTPYYVGNETNDNDNKDANHNSKYDVNASPVSANMYNNC